jgi:hypothetical protein
MAIVRSALTFPYTFYALSVLALFLGAPARNERAILGSSIDYLVCSSRVRA